jgi:hypothetical protein
MLDSDEWRQIDYLLWITQPFFDFTLELSKTKDATTHHVFMIYNKLFEHIERSICQLRRKQVPWKKRMLEALQAAQVKLSDYYSQTDSIRGDLYAIGAMLAPANKFQFFSTSDWDDKWRERYRNSFKEFLSPYQERLTSQLDLPISHASMRVGSRLDLMLSGNKHQPTSPKDELIQYLDSGESFISHFYLISTSRYLFKLTKYRYYSDVTSTILEGQSTPLSRYCCSSPGYPFNPSDWCWC